MSNFSGSHWLLTIAMIGGYFLPAIIAKARNHNSGGAIFLVTLLLGWTMIGWFVALIWAMNSNTRDTELRRANLTAAATQSAQAPAATIIQPAPSAASLADQLQQLAALRDAGTLTQDEFERSKAKLIG